LKAGEAALELIRIEPQADSVYYIGLMARPQAAVPQWFVLTAGKNIERHVNYHRNAVKFKLADRRSYNVMWAPLKPYLEGVRRLYFSADGAYYQINPYALYDAEQNRYVIDEIEIVFVSNTKYLIDTVRKAEIKKEAVLVGNPTYQIDPALGAEATAVDLENQGSYWLANARFLPLPGTEAEVNQIAALLKGAAWMVKVFKGVEAREENIKAIRKPGILHIATHGFFIPSPKDEVQSGRFISREALDEDPIDPMLRSGLVLAGVTDYFNGRREGRRDDGILTAYEAAHLDLSQTQLVVLSACETGLGKVQNGEGVYGLQRAFLLSGANYLVMSLWRVDDAATQQLMSRFYHYIAEGKEVPLAFKQAQMELRQKYSEPYFWAAFVLIEQ
jgi:CHAT domain-containing protein